MTAAFGDAVEEFRYLIMRTLRLIVATVFEIVTFVSAVTFALAGLTGMFFMLDVIGGTSRFWALPPGGIHAGWDIPAGRLLVISAVALCVLAFSCSQWLAVTYPYHYKTTMPGLTTKQCWKCGTEIPDHLRCPSCKAFRFGRVLTAGLWCLSLFITVFYVVHDITWVALGFVGAGKRAS